MSLPIATARPRQTRRRLAQSLFLALHCVAGAAYAQSATSVHVTARVLPNVTIDVRGPAALQVSVADVQQGYVQLPAPLRLHVQTNLQDGVQLEVLPRLDGILRTAVQVGGAWSSTPLHVPRGAVTLDVVLRIYLDPSVRPGTYPWPLQFASSA